MIFVIRLIIFRRWFATCLPDERRTIFHSFGRFGVLPGIPGAFS
jgi:hypothetical protein